ncbi:MAG TPA: hypothetical protein VD997_03985 [Phycisphaerales bacterium]|nr:hypothetical protein [Phycisphaerales bacterium]
MNQAQIGLSGPQTVAFKTLVEALEAAEDDAQVKREASKDATRTLNNSESAARIVAGAYVNLIKAFAETTGNPSVYSLSGVNADSPPGTLPAPVPPSKFFATLNADGSLTLRFRASQPKGVTGVVYQIFRRFSSDAPFTQVGSTGATKRWVDQTIPFGTDRVEYMVTPVRGEVVGESSDAFPVQFGSVGGGNFSISSGSGENKLAA